MKVKAGRLLSVALRCAGRFISTLCQRKKSSSHDSIFDFDTKWVTLTAWRRVSHWQSTYASEIKKRTYLGVDLIKRTLLPQGDGGSPRWHTYGNIEQREPLSSVQPSPVALPPPVYLLEVEYEWQCDSRDRQSLYCSWPCRWLTGRSDGMGWVVMWGCVKRRMKVICDAQRSHRANSGTDLSCTLTSRDLSFLQTYSVLLSPMFWLPKTLTD